MSRWPIRRLSDLLKIQNGFAFRSDLFNSSSAGLPIIRIRDLARGYSETFYDGDYDKLYVVSRGDILIGMDGEFRCYRWGASEALLNQRVCRLQGFTNDILPKFVFYCINRHLEEIEASTAFVTVKHISSTQIGNIELPVPPLAEQERIVRLLDDADGLLKLRNQADKRSAELIPALFEEMFGDSEAGGNRHHSRPLQDVCLKITDGTHQPPPFSLSGIPFLFVRNIVNGSIDFDTEKYITDETFDELARRVRPEPGDILYSTVGSYGVAVQVECKRKFSFQRHIGYLKPDPDKIDSAFLTAQLNTPFVRRQADTLARGVAQKTLNLAEIRKFNVVVPPGNLQKEFASRISEIRAMESQQSDSRRNLDALFQSMLHRAFQGVL